MGPSYKQEEIEKELKKLGANFKVLNYEDLINQTSEKISTGNAVGLGQRALGARSILGKVRKNAKKFKFKSKI